MQKILLRLVLCILPLALTPLWGFLIAEGYLNFGGGEKDLLILIPWLLWSVIYLSIFIFTWRKRMVLVRSVAWAVAGATALLGILWGVLFLWAAGFLGVS